MIAPVAVDTIKGIPGTVKDFINWISSPFSSPSTNPPQPETIHGPSIIVEIPPPIDHPDDVQLINMEIRALEGLRDDMQRMDNLLNYDLIRDTILRPSFKHPIFERLFSEQDRLILDVAMDKQVFQAADIRMLFPQKHPTEISKMIKWLRDKDLIIGIDENARRYSINLENKWYIFNF